MNTRYQGMPGYVPSEPISAHITALHDMGLPLASIARDAGVTREPFRLIYHRTWDTVRVRQAAAIKAVTHHPNPRQQIVLAVGAVRRLRALHAISWMWKDIAAHTPGVSASSIATLARPGHERTICSWETWAAIRDTYDALSGTPAPESIGAMRAKNAAADRRWPPPLDWEDHDIDDPRVTVKPSGRETRTGMDERAEWRRRDVARLTRVGFSADEIAVRLNVSQRQVVRDRAANAALCAVADDESAA